MKKTTWVCPRCNQVRADGDRVEIRVEHREVKGQGRRHTYKVREVCRSCSDAIAQDERPNRKPVFAPGYDSLFDAKEKA